MGFNSARWTFSSKHHAASLLVVHAADQRWNVRKAQDLVAAIPNMMSFDIS